jgi:glycosyltransferase involved in cell wall biosynthesis
VVNINLLWLSDSPFTNTGFSSQSLFLLNGLHGKGWNTNFQAHNYVGQSIPNGNIRLADNTVFNFNLHGNGRMPYSQDLIETRIQETQANIFGVLLDSFMVFPFWQNMNFSPAKTVFWFPSDGGGGMPNHCENVLRKTNYPVAMSKFAKKQLWDYYTIPCHYIPHGINEQMFKKLPDRENLRSQWGLNDKFVVGIIARNQGRKMLDKALKTMVRINEMRPNNNIIMLIHCDARDPAGVFDMMLLINRLGISNKIRFTGVKWYKGYTYEEMNMIYNLFDCFFLPTSGEGFGVPTIEAMSCKVPCVVTDYTTTNELLIENGKCGLPVKLVGTEKINFNEYFSEKNFTDYDKRVLNGTITGSWSVERGLMDINDGAKKILMLYDKENLRKKLGEVGRKKVEKYYTQEIVVNAWNDFLTDIYYD